MRQEDRLRNSLREYYDTRQTPYSEREWERASAYLDAARHRRRIRPLLIILATIGSALLITLLSLQKLSADDAQQALSLPPEQLNPATTSPELVPHTAITAEQKTGITPSLEAPEHSEDVSLPVIKPATDSPKQIVSLLSENTLPAPESKQPEPAPTVAEPEARANGVVTHDPDPVVAATLPAHGPVVNHRQEDPKPEISQDLSANEKIPPVANEFPPQEQKRPVTNEIAGTPINLQPLSTLNATLSETKKEILTTAVEDKILTPVANSSHPALTHGTISAMQAEVMDSLPKPGVFDHLAGEGIFYEAGAAWLYGWKGAGKRDARGFSPVAAIHYMNRLNSRCAFSFGLGYLRVPGLSHSSKTSRMSSYKYGEQSRVTVITPSAVHYLLAPLRFHYHANARNSFGLGVNLAYLLNVDATVTSYDERPGYTGNYETVKLGGYTQGFSWFDSQLAFCYRRKTGSVLGLQAEVFLGLTDVKQDAFFHLNNKERNSGAKLTLVYYAFRKNTKQ